MERKIVFVGGSGATEHQKFSEPLGKWIALQGYHLLTGGGGGVMTAVARGFCTVDGRKGLSIGVTRGDFTEGPVPDKNCYRSDPPNEFVEIPIRTHLPHSRSQERHLKMGGQSRNAIVVLTSDFCIFVSGAEGTESEAAIARNLKRKYVFFGPEANWHKDHPGIPLLTKVEELHQYFA